MSSKKWKNAFQFYLLLRTYIEYSASIKHYQRLIDNLDKFENKQVSAYYLAENTNYTKTPDEYWLLIENHNSDIKHNYYIFINSFKTSRNKLLETIVLQTKFPAKRLHAYVKSLDQKHSTRNI